MSDQSSDERTHLIVSSDTEDLNTEEEREKEERELEEQMEILAEREAREKEVKIVFWYKTINMTQFFS